MSLWLCEAVLMVLSCHIGVTVITSFPLVNSIHVNVQVVITIGKVIFWKWWYIAFGCERACMGKQAWMLSLSLKVIKGWDALDTVGIGQALYF